MTMSDEYLYGKHTSRDNMQRGLARLEGAAAAMSNALANVLEAIDDGDPITPHMELAMAQAAHSYETWRGTGTFRVSVRSRVRAAEAAEREDKNDVHGTHCCSNHGCKYGTPNCPVTLGDKPGVTCEQCQWEQDERDVNAFPDGHFYYAFSNQHGSPSVWVTTADEFAKYGCCKDGYSDPDTGELTPEGERMYEVMSKVGREDCESSFATSSHADAEKILAPYPDFIHHEGFQEFVTRLDDE